MTIQQLKIAVSQQFNVTLTALNMVRQRDEQGVAQPWLSYWDDVARVRVTMPEDVFNAIMANPNFDKLAYKHQMVTPKPNAKTGDQSPDYLRIVVITPKDIEGVF